MIVTIQLRRGAAAEWTAKNPVLKQGEAGLETDTGMAKMGDGTTAWNSLDYWNPSGGGTGSVDKTYAQAFFVANAVSVPHNLGKLPAVTVISSAGTEVTGDVAYTDVNNLTVTFSAPFSGKITCN